MNQDSEFSKEVTETRQQLRAMLPEQRCNFDGRIPVEPVWLSCGHVYCRACVQDISVTAALVGASPKCKTCYEEFYVSPPRTMRMGTPSLNVVRARYDLDASTKLSSLGPSSPQVDQGTLGEAAKRMLESIGASSLPWALPSHRVGILLDQYTIGSPQDQPRLPEPKSSRPSEELANGLLQQAQEFGDPFDAAVDMFTFEDEDFAHFDFGALPDLGDGLEMFQIPTTSLFELDASASGGIRGADPPSFAPHEQVRNQQIALQRDMSVFGGERFCFKGALRDQAAMEAAVSANGGVITGGGYKHTSYGVVGQGWKPTPSWTKNEVRVLSEPDFWQLLEQKKQERAIAKMGRG